MGERETEGPIGVPATTSAPTGSGREIRADLEGLRGVAVVGVLLFHLGAPWAAGGFVGVDAFFVLSGFLITGLLIREHARTGRISLPAFYARRVRRILPAALATIAATVTAAALLLGPLDVPGITLDGAAAALSVGNLRFAIEATDYFGPTTPSPFRHFWSLGVEEQFYLAWPALMILALGRGGSVRRVALVVAGVVVLSVAAAVWLTGVDQPWAFYSFPTRAWQLGLGGLLAVSAGWFARRSSLLLAPLAAAGLAALVAAFVVVDGTMPYPGTIALLPTLATAAVVVGGERPGPARWLLGLGPVRWLGRISYSLYLWHWPLLVVPVLALGRDLVVGERLALAALAIGVAALSWRWIEEPFRRGWSPSVSRRRTVLAGVGAMALTAVVAVGVGEAVVARLDVAASQTAMSEPVAGEASAEEAAANEATGDATAGEALQPDGTVADALESAEGSSPPLGALSSPVAPAPSGTPSTAVPAALPSSAAVPPSPTGAAPSSASATAAPRASAPVTSAASGARALPTDVRPKLTRARADSESIVRDGCSLALTGSRPPICSYGQKDAALTVALVGDSHAAHWFPALERLAVERGWRLVPLIKYSCPFVDLRIFQARLGREYTECEAWRANVVTALQKLEPDLVIVTSHRWFQTIVAGDGDPTRQGTAMARLLEQLPGRIAIFADTPIARVDVPACLASHLRDIRACATGRAYALGANRNVRERVAARLAGATFIDMTDVICPGKGSCAAVVRGMIVYRDDHHLTATFSASLAPVLGARLPEFNPGTP